MPVVTRSKARLGHLSDLIPIFRNGKGHFPRKVAVSPQGIAVVVGHEEVGSLSARCTATKGSQSFPGFGIFKCKDKRCITCPKYITEHKFKSNITQKN